MKVSRHAKIIELISQYDIETQEELAEYLNNAGFKVTQATVSRDIRDLKLTKISVSGGSGRSMENAVIDALKELQMIYNRKSDIVREISLIVSDYEQAGIPMSDGFAELGERSEIDDIVSFAAVYKTIEGKTSNFGYIISQTREIIKEKVEIAMEIETTITSSKAETYTMLVLPLALIVMMSSMGSGILDTLFTTFSGRIAATVGVVCTFVSFVIAARAVEIEV